MGFFLLIVLILCLIFLGFIVYSKRFKPLPFPISYRNYNDTSYREDKTKPGRPSYLCSLIDVRTGEALDYEVGFNQGYLTDRDFKLKQILALSKAEKRLGKDHPSIKALEIYLRY